jgi:hypothetical protein
MKKLFMFLFLIPLFLVAQPKQLTTSSTTTLLGSGATFTGALETVQPGYNWVQIVVKSNKASATSGLVVRWAKTNLTGYTYNTIDKRTYAANDTLNGANVYLFKVQGSYFKVSYTNTSSAQTGSWSLTTYLLQDVIPTDITGSVPVSITGSGTGALATELTQADNKTALQAIQKKTQQDRPSGLSYYSNLGGDFTATVKATTAKVAISGLPFTFDHKKVAYAAYRRQAGDWTYLGMEPTLGTGDTLVFGTTSFVSTDEVDIIFVGPPKTLDKALDVAKTIEQAPIWARYSSDQVTNVAAGGDGASATTRTVVGMDGYKSVSIQKQITVATSDTVTVSFWASNMASPSTANDNDWINVDNGFTQYVAGTAAVMTAAGIVTTGAATFRYMYINPNFNYKWLMIKRVVIDGSANSVVITTDVQRSY